MAQLSSEIGIHAQQITDWKRQALDGLPSLFESSTAKAKLTSDEREHIEGPLFQQIGHLKVENKWLKKNTDELGAGHQHLVEPRHPRLSISQQCELLGISRSGYYHRPVGETAQNLALMKRIDKLFMARSEMGGRQMYRELRAEGDPLNIKRVRRLMRLMGLEAVNPKPNLSKPQLGHSIYPYLLRGVSIERANQVWSTAQAALRHCLCADANRLSVPVCGYRLVQSVYFELALEQHPVVRFLY
jgi:putative transposase